MKLANPIAYSVGIRRIAFALGSALALALAGCTTTHRVRVDAINRPTPEPAVSYRLESGSPELDESTLHFKEAAKLVRTALAANGMYEDPVPAKAEMVVLVDYGMSDPKVRHEERAEPVYRRVWYPEQIVYVPVGKDAQGRTIYGQAIIPGRYEQVYSGEEYRLVTVVTYEKYLHLRARENGAGALNNGEELWSVHVSSESEKPELRKTLPLLTAAAMDHVGIDTRGEQTIKIREDDGAIEFVKQGM